jgi:hypothetical protein
MIAYLSKNMFDSLLADCNEIIALITKIIKTARENKNQRELN